LKTATLYTLSKSLSSHLQTPLTLHPSLEPSLRDLRKEREERERQEVEDQLGVGKPKRGGKLDRRDDPKTHKKDNIPPEVAMAAATILVLKWVYDLDGKAHR
jgi:RNA polymerase I-specific transcription initiation factor RRN7